jgi:long-chain acyl-CoA synthetase
MENRPWQRHYDWKVPLTLRYPGILAHEMLNLPANSYPDKPATHFYGTETSFWALRKQVLQMANALGHIGVKQGDRIGIHLPNCPQYIVAFYATLYLGAIAVNLNPMYTAVELTDLCRQVGVTTLFTFDLVLPNVRPICANVNVQRVVVTRVTDAIDGFAQSTPQELDLEKGWYHFSTLLENSTSTKLPKVYIRQDDAALIQFTGGTTGLPKGAVLTHKNLVAATLQVSVWGSSTMDMIPHERRNVMALLPFFHIYGTIVVLSWAIFNCATMILVPRFEIDEFMGILANFNQINFFPAVPTMINAVINHPKAEEIELAKRLGLFNSGGGPMPMELIEQARDMGINYSEGWGMTETTSLGISNPVMGLRKAGSIGIPWPDTDVKLVDITDGAEEVPVGEPGELLIRSPLVMKGYWNNPEETADQLKDGWLATGDIAVRDSDDYFSIVDRKKDMIIAGGYNIYPREIDEVLYQHPKVADAVAIGIPDSYRGESVKAFVVLKPGESSSEKEIIAFCREKLAAYKAPSRIEFRTDLPKSAVGKILRKILRDEALTEATNDHA